MSRIRSIHPGLWTDERFVSVSSFARLFYMGILNECDDGGVFEWSPLKLKMRILPADNVIADELLAELVTAGSVMKYDIDGRSYGAVRNFCKYQRPKKPNLIHPKVAEVLQFTGTSSEPVRNQYPTPSEKSPQRKEEGGNTDADASGAEAPVDLAKALFDSAVPYLVTHGSKERNARSMVASWRKDHGDGPVIDAVAAAQRNAVSEPIPFIIKYLERKDGQQTRGLQRNAPPPANPLLAAAIRRYGNRDSPDGGLDFGASVPATGGH